MSEAHERPIEAIRRSLLEVASAEDAPRIESFFAGAGFARGLATLHSDGPLALGLGIIVAAGDPVLEPCFGLREQLSDSAFDAAWTVDGAPRFDWVGHPAERRALVRCGFAASLQWPRGACRWIERGFLFDPIQVGATTMRRFSQAGCIIALVSERLTERERRRGGPRSANAILSNSLPLGVVTSDAPVVAIEQALAHVQLDDDPHPGPT